MRNILFICSQNRLRSPTAEQVFSVWSGINVASAGTNHDADNPVTPELLRWADVIIAMERAHRSKLQKKFKSSLNGKNIICLGIPDDYGYMDAELVRILEERVPKYLPHGASARRSPDRLSATKDPAGTTSQLFRFPTAVVRDPAITIWMHEHPGALGAIALRWFEAMRACGDDVRELLHDGHPTACVEDAAFGYVNAFTAHVNLGFFRGAELANPDGLLEGSGKLMRHVKLRPGEPIDEAALNKLVRAAYLDMQRRLQAG
jgi:predicted protein tyrosine phosphatase